MNRATLAVDRLVTLLLGIVLIAAGAAALAWWGGWVSVLSGSLDLTGLTAATGRSWWPWAVGAVGVILILLGLRWLASHLPDRGVAQLVLPGSGPGGRLHADVKSVATATADAFQDTPGVRSARGTIQRDRGQLVARLDARIEREADLEAVAGAADRVSGQLRQVLERDDLYCRVKLSVAHGRRSLPRVR